MELLEMNVPRSSPRPQHPPSQTHPNFRVSHVGRHAAGGKPPARAHERARARGLDALVSPLIPRDGDFGDNHRFRDDGARSTSRDEPRGHARGRRERVALHHAPTKASEDARAFSWPARVAARAGKSSSYFELHRVKSSYPMHFTIGTSYDRLVLLPYLIPP